LSVRLFSYYKNISSKKLEIKNIIKFTKNIPKKRKATRKIIIEQRIRKRNEEIIYQKLEMKT
jgi:hypothetical protein